MTEIQVKDIMLKHGSKVILESCSFNVKSGGRMALLGPSGCGKTTLLRAIAGLHRISSGTISLDNDDVTEISVEKRGIGLIFQRPLLMPHLDVWGNLRLGQKKYDEEEIRIMLDLIGLEGFGSRKVDQLSGGESQRIAVGRALLAKPRVLLLDGPFSNLDSSLRIRLSMDIAQILESRNTTAILVTHDANEAERFSHISMDFEDLEKK
ncbi:MAG: ABC transporter ATP-binding protein, partial [Candidatus Thermoplasmatota archaeon]|nr:ABC transporter ATP-binding protein [Candidatus Thermoplasmatota archaeon]